MPLINPDSFCIPTLYVREKGDLTGLNETTAKIRFVQMYGSSDKKISEVA